LTNNKGKILFCPKTLNNLKKPNTMKKALFILGMILMTSTITVSCTTDDMEMETQGNTTITENNDQTNIDPKKGN
jgi:hypothetical protein